MAVLNSVEGQAGCIDERYLLISDLIGTSYYSVTSSLSIIEDRLHSSEMEIKVSRWLTVISGSCFIFNPVKIALKVFFIRTGYGVENSCENK